MKLSIAFLLVITTLVLCDNNILSIRDYYQDNINDTDFHYYLESTNGKYFDVVIDNNYQCYSVTKCNFTIDKSSKLVIINNNNDNGFNNIKLEKIQNSKFIRYIYDENSTLYDNENSTLYDDENSTFDDINSTLYDNENSTFNGVNSTVYSTLVNSTVDSANSTVDSYSSFYSNTSDVNVTLYIILSLVLVIIIAILVIIFLIGFVFLYRNKCRKPEYI